MPEATLPRWGDGVGVRRLGADIVGKCRGHAAAAVDIREDARRQAGGCGIDLEGVVGRARAACQRCLGLDDGNARAGERGVSLKQRGAPIVSRSEARVLAPR